jgi:transcriptional regulator of heat shock response
VLYEGYLDVYFVSDRFAEEERRRKMEEKFNSQKNSFEELCAKRLAEIEGVCRCQNFVLSNFFEFNLLHRYTHTH